MTQKLRRFSVYYANNIPKIAEIIIDQPYEQVKVLWSKSQGFKCQDAEIEALFGEMPCQHIENLPESIKEFLNKA